MPKSNVTIGRIVRFIDPYGQKWPAIVTAVHSDAIVSLQVFRQSDIIPVTSVPYAQPTEIAKVETFTWHWPDRS